jgi:hypothetical protein
MTDKAKTPHETSRAAEAEDTPLEAAAGTLEKSLPSHQRTKVNALFGGGVFKKLIAQVIQGLISSLLSGAGAAPQAPLDALSAHHSEKFLAEVQAALPPEQLAALNGLNIDWKKFITAVIQALLSSLTSTPNVPESAPKV